MTALLFRNWEVVIGGIVVGLAILFFWLWLDRHDAALLEGYVTLSEKTALQAELDEMQRQRDAAQQAIGEYQKEFEKSKVVELAAAAETEKRINVYAKRLAETQRNCLADDDDVDFIVRHH